MKIIHIITGLKDGGAENILYKICKYDISNEHIVISLTNGDKYFSLLKKLGIKIYCMNMTSYSVFKFFDLVKLIFNTLDIFDLVSMIIFKVTESIIITKL